MTRPEIPINWDKVDELLMAGCPGTEVASFFGMHEETFYDRVAKKYGVAFSEYKAKKAATGEALLRMQQYTKAMGLTAKGDNTLLIFLGKVRLGQRENANEKMAPAEVLAAFSDLMKQLDAAQSLSKRAEVLEASVAEAASAASSASSSNCMTQPCKESAFR
jgi:hypothetical protein